MSVQSLCTTPPSLPRARSDSISPLRPKSDTSVCKGPEPTHGMIGKEDVERIHIPRLFRALWVLVST